MWQRPEIPDLPATLAALIEQIPPGRVATCGALATALGNPVAARWVGYYLTHHPHTATCTCHRVVLATGELSVDVSYRATGLGAATYALVETDTGQLVWSHTISRPVKFPYITSYLTFREMPILLDLLEEVKRAGRLSEVLLVDGSGMLHPRHAGIATHLGVSTAIPTIGVTKKLLCGQVDLSDFAPEESRPVLYEGKLIGVALRTTAGSSRPIFLSCGHRVNLAFCENLVRRLLTGRRLPEPLYWADRLSHAACMRQIGG